MTRDEFYKDDICREVARVSCRNDPNLRQEGWTGEHSQLTKAQCDSFIQKHNGDVAKAYNTAMRYLEGGNGVAEG